MTFVFHQRHRRMLKAPLTVVATIFLTATAGAQVFAPPSASTHRQLPVYDVVSTKQNKSDGGNFSIHVQGETYTPWECP